MGAQQKMGTMGSGRARISGGSDGIACMVWGKVLKKKQIGDFFTIRSLHSLETWRSQRYE